MHVSITFNNLSVTFVNIIRLIVGSFSSISELEVLVLSFLFYFTDKEAIMMSGKVPI